MVLTMVYSKVTTLRNVGDKSIGEASNTNQDKILPNMYYTKPVK